ncbi:MAG: hypothetical protein QNI91_18015 [Arenicellales bacterium]|nr:hypothetical protein [Arenicellales bacterium]
MRKIFGYAVIIVVALVLNSCASTAGSPAFRLPPGSKVQVLQELNAPSGSRLSIQYGQVLPRQKVTAVDPHCQFYLYRSKEEMREPIVIRPGTYIVKRTLQRPDYVWNEELKFARVGSESKHLTAVQRFDFTWNNRFQVAQAGGQTRHLVTIIELSSGPQSEVRELRCGIWGMSRLDGYLSLNQMQSALGGLVKLVVETE